MAMKSGSLNYWRDYFRTSSYDIFDIIEHAIVVAASDCSKEFRLRRDRIAELLFSSTLTRCSGCDQVQLAVPANDEEDGGCRSGLDRDGDEFEAGASKESKSNGSRDDHAYYNDRQGFSNYSYGEAEALTDEIEEESQIIGEVLRIKELLLNSEEESDSVLYESLRRLQLMALTVDILQATEIGKVVSRLRKHGSKEICNLARTLYIGWKDLAEEWLKATTAITASEGTPDSVNPSVLDEEEGLPSPPMDEAFLATQTGSIDFSQIFDGMDDDGNPRNCGEIIKNQEDGRKLTLDNHIAMKRKQQRFDSIHAAAGDGKSNQVKKQENVAKLTKASNPPAKQEKLSNTDSGPRTPPKLVKEQKQSNNFQTRQKRDKNEIVKTPAFDLQNKFKHTDEAVVQMKLEATKRKLQERYQQVENAKRQRTIQVMELHDLPKQGMGHRNPHVKPGNHNRQWSQGRR